MASNNKYLTKHVSFAGAKVTLYSLDGDTWSSRPDELESIKERHEQEKASYSGQIKGGPQARIPTTRPKPTSVTAQYARALRDEKLVPLKDKAHSPEAEGPATAPVAHGRKTAPLIPPKGKPAKAEKSARVEKIMPASKDVRKGKAALPVKVTPAAASDQKKKKIALPKARSSGKPVKATKAKGRISKKAVG